MTPADRVVRRVEGNRLAYYRRAADSAFWDEHWSRRLDRGRYEGAERGEIDMLEIPLTRHLPKQGKILEAGCGIGRYVMALRARGYDVEGIDLARETVRAVRRIYPDLPVRVGDATRIEAADGTYRGYVSLGVVEHRWEGPEPFLAEANRVLASGGIALVSVPYLNPLRLAKARLGRYHGEPKELEFYQYAFRKVEFGLLLERTGFEILDTFGYDGLKCMRDEIAGLRRAVEIPPAGPYLRRALASWRWLGEHLGHMILFICKKRASAGLKDI